MSEGRECTGAEESVVYDTIPVSRLLTLIPVQSSAVSHQSPWKSSHPPSQVRPCPCPSHPLARSPTHILTHSLTTTPSLLTCHSSSSYVCACVWRCSDEGVLGDHERALRAFIHEGLLRARPHPPCRVST